jgi:SWI/SNF-related matrix-associated actin-dependent regulator of chromatin subfamily A-like protein 1
VPAQIDPKKIPFDLIAKIRHETGKLKAQAAIDFIREETADSDEKTIVFAHHRDVLGRVAASLAQAVMVSGDTSLADRQKAIEAFQTNANLKYFVANTQAMGSVLRSQPLPM